VAVVAANSAQETQTQQKRQAHQQRTRIRRNAMRGSVGNECARARRGVIAVDDGCTLRAAVRARKTNESNARERVRARLPAQSA